MSAILVTGAGGLIGRELVPALRGAGYSVVTTSGSAAAVDLPAQDLSLPEVAGELVRRVRPAVVVHLAGGIAASRHELYRRNVLTTIHLLEGLANLEAPAYCVVFGSAAEYGDGEGAALGEGARLAPLSDYGRAKVAQTTLAEGIAVRHGIPLTVLRPFNLVGPTLPASSALGNLRRQLLAAAVTATLEPAVTCGRLDIVRDYVAIATVVEAVTRLVAQPRPACTINVCSGVGVELADIVSAMAAILGLAPRLAADPALVARPAALRVVGDPSRMRELLGLSVAMSAEIVARIVLER